MAARHLDEQIVRLIGHVQHGKRGSRLSEERARMGVRDGIRDWLLVAA